MNYTQSRMDQEQEHLDVCDIFHSYYQKRLNLCDNYLKKISFSAHVRKPCVW